MCRRPVLLATLAISMILMTTGCSPGADADGPESTQASDGLGPGASGSSGGPDYDPPPSDAEVPELSGSLESHRGDADHFYVDTDDYVAWARPSTHTEAEWEYRLVCFDGDGHQSLAFLKYVFSDEVGAQEFAETSDLLVQVADAVYYKSWLGPESRTKSDVVELAMAEGGEYYVSQP